MARIAREFTNGNNSVVMGITKNLAEEVFDNLKQTNYQLAVAFWEQYKYFQYTGRLMN